MTSALTITPVADDEAARPFTTVTRHVDAAALIGVRIEVRYTCRGRTCRAVFVADWAQHSPASPMVSAVGRVEQLYADGERIRRGEGCGGFALEYGVAEYRPVAESHR